MSRGDLFSPLLLLDDDSIDFASYAKRINRLDMTKEDILNLIASEESDNEFVSEEIARQREEIIQLSEALWLSEFNDSDVI